MPAANAILRLPQRCRGAALITVLLLTTALALVAASMIQYAQTESRLNRRSRLVAQSRYLAESQVDYGFAQMAGRFTYQSVLPTDEFQRRPLRVLRDAFTSDAGANPAWAEVVGGTVPQTASFHLIDALDPNNAGDPLRGQIVFAREINVYGRAAIVDPLSGESIVSHASQRLQVRDAPLFANAIFYNLDLELSPGAPMTVHGSVHSNRALYLVTDSTLHFRDSLTAAGRLFHGAAPGSGREQDPAASKASNIRIDRPRADGTAAVVDMFDGSVAVQSSIEGYRGTAEARWARRVQTEEHGIQPQRPIALEEPAMVDDAATAHVDESNPGHTLIAPARPLTAESTAVEREIEQQRYANKAGMRVVVNPRTGETRAYARELDSYGNPVRDEHGNVIEAPVVLPTGLVTTGARMHDQRRNANTSNADNRVHLAELDIGKLKQVVESPGAAPPDRIDGFDTRQHWNGVVYIESSDTNNTGIRLVNGAQLPDPNRHASVSPGGARGLTVATNNALYVKGHYNADGTISSSSARFPDDWNASTRTSGEPPAALAADAITLLSSAWSDDNSGRELSKRIPVATEIGAALLTGIVRSQHGNYSGGVENLPRFLENWSGRTVAIRGSMVCLFESRIATQRWPGTGTVYNAPTRVWGFNELFRTGVYPPGTPVTRTYRRIHYRTLPAAEYEREVTDLRAAASGGNS